MRIAIAGYGTWGDVLPSLSLGLGLQRAGHNVRLMVPRDFEPWARDRGLEISPLPVDVQVVTQPVSSQTNPFAVLAGIRQSIRPALLHCGFALSEATKECNVLLANEWLLVAASAVAEANQIQLIHFAMQPIIPTRSIPIATMPAWPTWLPFRRLYHLFSYRWAHAVRWWVYAGAQNRIRRTAGQRPLSLLGFERLFRETPSLTLVSPHLVPRPPDWASQHRQPGAIGFKDAAWDPPAHLVDFLESGPPPIYLGFGSTHDRWPERTTKAVRKALERAGVRAIVHRGWAGLESAINPNKVLAIDYVPHEWLFPRVAAAVHHAGAGTTAATLRAGIPSVPVPHSGDQAFWARRLAAHGVATDPLPRSRLTVESLSERISLALSDSTMRSRAQALGAAVRGERGLERAVAAVEDFARIDRSQP